MGTFAIVLVHNNFVPTTVNRPPAALSHSFVGELMPSLLASSLVFESKVRKLGLLSDGFHRGKGSAKDNFFILWSRVLQRAILIVLFSGGKVSL